MVTMYLRDHHTLIDTYDYPKWHVLTPPIFMLWLKGQTMLPFKQDVMLYPKQNDWSIMQGQKTPFTSIVATFPKFANWEACNKKSLQCSNEKKEHVKTCITCL